MKSMTQLKEPMTFEICFVIFSDSVGSDNLNAFKNSFVNIMHGYSIKKGS
jgi:hypothetical protein